MIEDSEFTNKASHDAGEVLFDSGGTSDCYKLIVGNRAYCIKRPKPDKCHSSEYMALFRKEFELGIDMEHPNIVRYFDYGDDERGPFIRMDFVDGDNLEQFAAKHPDFFSKKENRERLLDELLSALAYLHDKQMLHLDLKPSNILITNKGYHVRLIDLGFAWSESYLYDAGFSRDYCAPEQLENRTDCIGPATDIYALGKVMQQFHLAKDAVVRRCLKENPKERFQSVEELKTVLQTKRKASFFVVALFAVLVISVLLFLRKPKQNEAVELPEMVETTEIANDSVAVIAEDTVRNFVMEENQEQQEKIAAAENSAPQIRQDHVYQENPIDNGLETSGSGSKGSDDSHKYEHCVQQRVCDTLENGEIALRMVTRYVPFSTEDYFDLVLDTIEPWFDYLYTSFFDKHLDYTPEMDAYMEKGAKRAFELAHAKKDLMPVPDTIAPYIDTGIVNFINIAMIPYRRLKREYEMTPEKFQNVNEKRSYTKNYWRYGKGHVTVFD